MEPSLEPPNLEPGLAKRQIRAGVVLIALVGFVAGAGWAVYKSTLAAQILAGPRDHDFGVVILADKPVELEHTFTLTNYSSRVVEIAELKTTCGCTVAEPSGRSVAPGTTVDVDATLTLDREGRKSSKIFIVFADGDRDVLKLSAETRRKRRLVLDPGSGRMLPGVAMERGIAFADYDSNEPPPQPSIEVPPGLTVTFEGWELVKRRERSRGLPARWRGTLTADPGATPPAAAVVVITMPEDQAAQWAMRSGDAPQGSPPG